MKKEVNYVLNKLKKIPEVQAVILFGSYAKKEQKPYSDIDIAVVLNPINEEVEDEIFSLSSNSLDVVPFNKVPLYIQFEILKHGKILFMKNKRFFTDLVYKIISNYLEQTRMYKIIGEQIGAKI
ncbi:MAG: nucleotidyltransferase domain-containing protein [Nanoarchaeota archaeon]|nr:nucleotidyltransferase domain-containing protein [Nanoarchaeota archaeon]